MPPISVAEVRQILARLAEGAPEVGWWRFEFGLDSKSERGRRPKGLAAKAIDGSIGRNTR